MILPDLIELIMAAGATLAVSISGGKDSQTMLRLLAREYAARSWPGQIMAVHADLGRMEWPQSLGECERQCRELGIDLVIVRRPQGDLLQEMQDRMEKVGTEKPFWPSSSARYCTSDQKRGQIDKVLRKSSLVISAEGIRAEESPARAKKAVVEMRRQITASALRDLSLEDALAMRNDSQRLAVTWRPILHWKIQEIWRALGTSVADVDRRRALYQAGAVAQAFDGWQAHPAYIFGNERVSCALCILASLNDLQVGAEHNPDLYDELVRMEDSSGWSFQPRRSLGNIFDESD